MRGQVLKACSAESAAPAALGDSNGFCAPTASGEGTQGGIKQRVYGGI